MQHSPNDNSLRLLVLSSCEQQLDTLRDWLQHQQEASALIPDYLLLDADQHWLSSLLQDPIEHDYSRWQAAVIVIDEICDQRLSWLRQLHRNLPCILISHSEHRAQFPAAFQWLDISSTDRSHFARSFSPLQLCLRPDLPPPLERNEFISRLKQRLQQEQPLYLQVIQCRWLRQEDHSSWQQQQFVQTECERSIHSRAPDDALIGRLLDDQLIAVSNSYYSLQADWLPQHPDDDLRPWVTYHSSPLHLSDTASLGAVLQEGVQQIARERLVKEARFEWRQEQSMNLFDGLHLALQRDEFYLEYQPQFDSRSGTWTGAEALMRWRHPTLGVIPPTVFIHEAEAAGLIQALGQWALRETAASWRLLHDMTGERVRLAVNVSFPEVADPYYAQQVLDVLEQTGMPASCLELELTETAMMQDASVSMFNLRQLKEAGVHIVLDDFGTGFSSLSHLSDLPLTGIKLDRAFVSPLPDHGPQTHIVTSMLELAHRLGLETTAEGVEDIACLELVSRLGCDRIQGYVYARPLPLEELIRQAQAGFAAPADFNQGRLF